MTSRTVKQPGPDHPITIEPNPQRVVVKVGDRVIADSLHALTLREAAYGPVQYVPMADVDASLLEASDHTTYCPYKGECSYFSIPTGGARSINAVWCYKDPYPAVAAIKGHVAFYPDRADGLS